MPTAAFPFPCSFLIYWTEIRAWTWSPSGSRGFRTWASSDTISFQRKTRRTCTPSPSQWPTGDGMIRTTRVDAPTHCVITTISQIQCMSHYEMGGKKKKLTGASVCARNRSVVLCPSCPLRPVRATWLPHQLASRLARKTQRLTIISLSIPSRSNWSMGPTELANQRKAN